MPSITTLILQGGFFERGAAKLRTGQEDAMERQREFSQRMEDELVAAVDGNKKELLLYIENAKKAQAEFHDVSHILNSMTFLRLPFV